LDAIELDSKTYELLQRLEEIAEADPNAKVLIFTQFRDTQSYLAERIGAPWSAHLFHGQLSPSEKDQAVIKFRDLEGPQILISTEAGGEGRNFQFCHMLVNYDLPWNPMKVEQRIGRIDRIGQSREVFVFNLVTRGTLEEQILALLDEKISMFELVVGEVGAILGGLEEEREFPDLVLEAWLGTTEAARLEAFAALGQRLEQARQQHEDAKALDEKLFGEDFETV
jgi:SNF2 family DNA or RNA helicase